MENKYEMYTRGGNINPFWIDMQRHINIMQGNLENIPADEYRVSINNNSEEILAIASEVTKTNYELLDYCEEMNDYVEETKSYFKKIKKYVNKVGKNCGAETKKIYCEKTAKLLAEYDFIKKHMDDKDDFDIARYVVEKEKNS